MISPGTFLPSPNPPEVLQEKSVTTSLCVWLLHLPALDSLGKFIYGFRCKTWAGSSEEKNVWKFLGQFDVELRTLCAGASPSSHPSMSLLSPCLNYPLVTLLFLNKLGLFFHYLKLMTLLEVVTNDTLNAFFSAVLTLNSQWKPPDEFISSFALFAWVQQSKHELCQGGEFDH